MPNIAYSFRSSFVYGHNMLGSEDDVIGGFDPRIENRIEAFSPWWDTTRWIPMMNMNSIRRGTFRDEIEDTFDACPWRPVLGVLAHCFDKKLVIEIRDSDPAMPIRSRGIWWEQLDGVRYLLLKAQHFIDAEWAWIQLDRNEEVPDDLRNYAEANVSEVLERLTASVA